MVGSHARLDGYRSAMHLAGLPVPDGWARFEELDAQAGERVAFDLLRRSHPPTAILAGSDMQALGVLNAALPFWLIAWGEQYIDSGLAAVVQASVPIFNALLILRFLPHERLTRTRAAGLAIGAALASGDRRYDYDRRYYRQRGYYPTNGYYYRDNYRRYRGYDRCSVRRVYDPYLGRTVRVRYC